MSSMIASALNDFLNTYPAAPDFLKEGTSQGIFCAFSGSAGAQGAVTVLLASPRDPDHGLILKISREQTSTHLMREAEMLTRLHNMLPPFLREAVPVSLHVGKLSGRPYSVTTALPGTNWRSLTPGWSRCLRHRMALSAVDWIARLGRETLQSDALGLDPAALEPLELYVQEAANSQAGRKAARALGVLKEAGRSIPHLVQQRDFWPGNVLVNGKYALSGVVDWEGTLPDGYPGCDCTKLTTNLYGTRARPYIERYCAVLDHPAVTADVCIALATMDIILTRSIVGKQISGRARLERGRTCESLIDALPQIA